PLSPSSPAPYNAARRSRGALPTTESEPRLIAAVPTVQRLAQVPDKGWDHVCGSPVTPLSLFHDGTGRTTAEVVSPRRPPPCLSRCASPCCPPSTPQSTSPPARPGVC